MSDYTHVKFDDVDDVAAARGVEGFEARFARDALGSRDSGVTKFVFAPNHRIPFGHKHAEQEETYVVISGSLTLRVEDEFVQLAPWDVVRVGPEPVRGFESGPEGAVMVVFGAGPKGDGEMVKGWWED